MKLHNEAFTLGLSEGWRDYRNAVNSERLTKQEASEMIGKLKGAIEKEKALNKLGTDKDELALSIYNACEPGVEYSMREVAENLGVDFEKHQPDFWNGFGRLLGVGLISSTRGDGKTNEAFRFSVK